MAPILHGYHIDSLGLFLSSPVGGFVQVKTSDIEPAEKSVVVVFCLKYEKP